MFDIVFIASNILLYPVLSSLSWTYHLPFSIFLTSAFASFSLSWASCILVFASFLDFSNSFLFFANSDFAFCILVLLEFISFCEASNFALAVFLLFSNSFFCFCSSVLVASISANPPLNLFLYFLWQKLHLFFLTIKLFFFLQQSFFCFF